MIEAVLIGGPRDGEVLRLHAAMTRIHVNTATPPLVAAEGKPKRPRSDRYHLYVLREFNRLMQTSGQVRYQYEGVQR